MAERLELVRKRETLSQEAFSQRLGISRGAYQHYSKGGREIPSSVLDAMEREFGIDPYWMLRGDDRGSSTKAEEVLVENAALVALALRDAYDDKNIVWSEDKIVNATKFAVFDIFDKRKLLTDYKEKLWKYAGS